MDIPCSLSREAEDLMDLYGFGNADTIEMDDLSEKSSVLSGPVRR